LPANESANLDQSKNGGIKTVEINIEENTSRRSVGRRRKPLWPWIAGGAALVVALLIFGLLVTNLNVAAGSFDPGKAAVRKWLHLNHNDPTSIEEVIWHKGKVDPFYKTTNTDDVSERYMAEEYKGSDYVYLRFREGTGIARRISEMSFILNEDGEIVETLHGVGNFDNPHEKHPEYDESLSVDQLIPKLDLE